MQTPIAATMGSTTPDWGVLFRVTKAVRDGGGTALNFSNMRELTDDLVIPLLHDGLTELDFKCAVRASLCHCVGVVVLVVRDPIGCVPALARPMWRKIVRAFLCDCGGAAAARPSEMVRSN